MGDEILKAPTKLVMIDENGNKNEIQGIIDEIKIERDSLEKEDFNRIVEIKNFNYEFKIKPEKLTRKRFIKLLMSQGVARNGAKDIAEYVRKRYGQYSPIFLMML